MGELEGMIVSTTVVRSMLVSAFAALVAAPLARAELPSLQPIQNLEPTAQEISPDPEGFPQSTMFATSLALKRNTLMSGMPGAFDFEGRVAIFTRRDADSPWRRSGTLAARDAARGARFGTDVALAGGRALVASPTAVYAFALRDGVWRQTQKLTFDEPVQIADVDWNGSIAIVGVGVNDLGTRSNGVYAFGLTRSGQLRRIAKFTAHDTGPADLFGNHVAISGSRVAIAAPGYNADQGAVYVFSCTLSGCLERQKLLANDGKPGDDFGSSVDLEGEVLVVGAEGADAANPREDTSRGAGYVFVKANGEWLEAQKLGLTDDEADHFLALGFTSAISGNRIALGSVSIPGFSPGLTAIYERSGGSFVPTQLLQGMGESLALAGSTAVTGFPSRGIPPIGSASVYRLP